MGTQEGYTCRPIVTATEEVAGAKQYSCRYCAALQPTHAPTYLMQFLCGTLSLAQSNITNCSITRVEALKTAASSDLIKTFQFHA